MSIRPILSALLRNKTGAILVALQVAISLAIMANALHIVSQRLAIAARPSGVADESTLLYLNVHHLSKGSHEQQLARQHAETAALRAVGGVTSAAWISQMPLSWSGSNTSIALDRKQNGPSADDVSFYVSPESIIDTLGLKLVEGRDFNAGDIVTVNTATADTEYPPPTVIITRSLARKLWPDAASVVGKTLYFGFGASATASRVVGVVDMLQSPNAEVDPRGYLSVISPARTTFAFDSNYVARVEPGQRERVMKEAEQALRRSSATPVIIKTRTVQQDRAERYRADIALAWMLAAVSLLLLLVTASGIVGMASLWVTQRRKQIGVRRALGARKRDILAYFITENVMITSLGVAGGVLLAAGLDQLLVARLHMERLPPGYLAAGAAVFWALGALAAWGPAWRGAAISPAIATRSA
ncbi:MAG: FtsX-like permease family protein [Massilia sp.]|nr:FtsX-like permease family protein [Massilia sp.]